MDYDKTLGQQYNEVQRFKSLETLPKITQSQLDSATEKCEHAIKDMHRPIVKTGTANGARIITSFGGQSREISTCLNKDTYQHIATTEESEAPEYFTGRISSFDSNTNKGRIFVPKEARTIPFILIENQYTDMYRDLVGMSLMHNIRNRKSNDGNIRFHAFKLTSRTGTLKSLNVIEVTKVNYEHINDNI